MRSVIFAGMLLFVLMGPAAAEQAKEVSLIQLMGNPEKFDGKTVRVIGFLRLELEANVLYLHREDFERLILPNGIWIELTDAQLRSSQKLSDNYAVVEGRFEVREVYGIWSGSLRASSLKSYAVGRSSLRTRQNKK